MGTSSHVEETVAVAQQSHEFKKLSGIMLKASLVYEKRCEEARMAHDEISETKMIEFKNKEQVRVESGRETLEAISAQDKRDQESHKQKYKTEDLSESWYFTHI